MTKKRIELLRPRFAICENKAPASDVQVAFKFVVYFSPLLFSVVTKFAQRFSHFCCTNTAVMDMVITNLQQQRLVTEQLRREAALKRITVSKAVEDIMKYITEHEQEDCLLLGFSSQKSNPFREKSTCILL